MNRHLRVRLEAIHQQLLAAHRGGDAMSNATRGSEREAFVDLLLRGCLPHPYRFGSGEVTDAIGNISGQIDLVIEHPFYPSFPLLGTSQHRLYLVEGVAMGIEIKSSASQFADAVETMKKFHALDPAADWLDENATGWSAPAVDSVGGNVYTSFAGRVGFGIVLYEGWQRPETLKERCIAAGVDVALQLNPPVFYAAPSLSGRGLARSLALGRHLTGALGPNGYRLSRLRRPNGDARGGGRALQGQRE